MTAKLFKAITKTNEVKKYLTFLFKALFDRVDFNFLNHINLYEIYR